MLVLAHIRFGNVNESFSSKLVEENAPQNKLTLPVTDGILIRSLIDISGIFYKCVLSFKLPN